MRSRMRVCLSRESPAAVQRTPAVPASGRPPPHRDHPPVPAATVRCPVFPSDCPRGRGRASWLPVDRIPWPGSSPRAGCTSLLHGKRPDHYGGKRSSPIEAFTSSAQRGSSLDDILTFFSNREPHGRLEHLRNRLFLPSAIRIPARSLRRYRWQRAGEALAPRRPGPAGDARARRRGRPLSRVSSAEAQSRKRQDLTARFVLMRDTARTMPRGADDRGGPTPAA